MRRKFAVFYCPHNPDPNKAGKRYKPPRGKMLMMSDAGVFFEYDGRQFYPYAKPLVDVIGNFDVIWNDPSDHRSDAEMGMQWEWGTTRSSVVYPHTTTEEKTVKSITELSDDELEAEMKRRREAMEAAKRPKPMPSPDFSNVVSQCAEYIKQLSTLGYSDEDLKDYVFEAAVEAIYGQNIWDWVCEKQGD